MRTSPHKDNATLNKVWAKHVKKFGKKVTSTKRRMRNKKLINKEIKEL